MTELIQTFHDLVRVETMLWNAIDTALLNECGLTLARFETMQIINRSSPCRVLDIAEALAIGWSGGQQDRGPGRGRRTLPPPSEPRRRKILTDHADTPRPRTAAQGQRPRHRRTPATPRCNTDAERSGKPEPAPVAFAHRTARAHLKCGGPKIASRMHRVDLAGERSRSPAHRLSTRTRCRTSDASAA